ncbi:MAG: hypothetical protein K0U84_10555 [Actinomycetia bacterium]|nr:hypothetical protein [Actinomycetes bacterium]
MLVRSAAELREELEVARQESRRRYRQYLIAALEAHDVAAAVKVADLALDALFASRDSVSGEKCGCACHPRLPDSDLHSYGFDCRCRWTADQRAETGRKWLDGIRAFWDSPEGKHLAALGRAERVEVRAWAAEQALDVVFDELGGECPEQWSGSVDGHRFYFRERHGEWRIELDVRPSGRFAKVICGTDSDGSFLTENQEIEEGDIIATGGIEQPGYGITLLERGQFIVEIIGAHLARRACTRHSPEQLLGQEKRLGCPVLWCPSCGARTDRE